MAKGPTKISGQEWADNTSSTQSFNEWQEATKAAGPLWEANTKAAAKRWADQTSAAIRANAFANNITDVAEQKYQAKVDSLTGSAWSEKIISAQANYTAGFTPYASFLDQVRGRLPAKGGLASEASVDRVRAVMLSNHAAKEALKSKTGDTVTFDPPPAAKLTGTTLLTITRPRYPVR